MYQAINPLQVRIAESQAERENKLFIGMLPKTIDEDGLRGMFSPYGELREVHIIRGTEGSSKGCAFVKFVDREAAMVAIEDMHDLIPTVSLLFIV
jgi:CUG-BP- and ETR3-like factor